jgi:succinoglycan biosynthesis protein ExoM
MESPPHQPFTISICIATYRRPQRLGELLADLARQTRLPDQVVVVDNDAAGSARAVVEAFRAGGAPFAVDYDIQPAPNIAMTRNRTVELAHGDWIASVDDDERAPPEWLGRLIGAVEQHRADGVLGPVDPQLPDAAPAWISRGRFYDFPRLPTGAVVPLNRMRFGNVILRAALMRAEPGPFDACYGLATGEDGDLLIRLVKRGGRIVWCDEAIVHERIESTRLSLRWLMQRALSGGQEFARKSVSGRYGPISSAGRTALLLRSIAQMICDGGLALLSLPAGRHVAARWLIAACANFGKLSVFWGWHYSEYAKRR